MIAGVITRLGLLYKSIFFLSINPPLSLTITIRLKLL
jgi:hypothetical protein